MIKALTIKKGIIQDKEIDGIPVITKIVTPKGKNNVRSLIAMPEVIGVTNHNTGNSKADDSDHAKWIQNVEDADKLYVSPHIFVDCDSITQVIPLNEVGWHAGDGRGNGNMKTIGVEICEDREIEKAEENAKKLNAALLLTFKGAKVYKHQDWNGKYCPHIILKRGGWDAFVKDIDNLVKAATVKPTAPVKDTKPEQKPAEVKKETKPKADGLRVGDVVRISINAVNYATGQRIPTSVKLKRYTVAQIKPDRVLLKEIMSWVKLADVTKA